MEPLLIAMVYKDITDSLCASNRIKGNTDYEEHVTTTVKKYEKETFMYRHLIPEGRGRQINDHYSSGERISLRPGI